MQHAEKANLCTKVPRIASDFEKGFGAGTNEEIVEDLFVVQHQGGQLPREGKDHVQLAGRQKFSATSSNPPCAGRSLTLRAVTIAARNGELSITCIMGSFF